MFCIYCGTDNADDAIFCRSCGKAQNKAANPQSMEMLKSPLSRVPTGDVETLSAGTSKEGVEKQPSSTLSSLPFGQTSSQNVTNPPASASSFITQQNIGPLTVICGGLIALFAFFSLPYLSLGFFGTLTGSQLANTNNQLIQGTGALWLEPLVAVVVIGIAIYLLVGNQRREIAPSTIQGVAVSLVSLAGLTLLVLLIKYATDAQPSTSASNPGFTGPSIASFYGAGVWIYFLAIVIVLVGGIVQLVVNSSNK